MIKLENDQYVPADCMLLQAGNEAGTCYISTESLDGERNLKPKYSLSQLEGQLPAIPSEAKIEFIQPDKSIYNFSG